MRLTPSLMYVMLACRCPALPLLVAVEGGEAADDVAGFGGLPIREGMIGADFVRQLHLAAPDGQQVRAVRLRFHTGDLPADAVQPLNLPPVISVSCENST